MYIRNVAANQKSDYQYMTIIHTFRVNSHFCYKVEILNIKARPKSKLYLNRL